MSIKLIAIELYKAQQKVHKLEEKLEAAQLQEKDGIRKELRVAMAELRQMRNMLEGQKASSPHALGARNK